MIKKRALTELIHPLQAVVVNLVYAFIIYFLARNAFLLENLSLFADTLTFKHLLELFLGGLAFDTSAILYTNALWVAMVLFPLQPNKTKLWNNVCRTLFVSVNTLALAVNLIDAVYFRYSVRRTTTTVFQEFQNENNLGDIFLTESLSHWYFFLLTAIVGYALWRLYMPTLQKNATRHLWLARLLSLLLFIPFCVAGMRGGWTRVVRPITISNANNYCDRPIETGIVLNTPFSLIRTIGKNHFEVRTYFDNPQELASVFNPVHQPQSTHEFRKKNVVVLIIESFGREYIGTYNRHLDNGRYKGFTPFLDSLLTNGALTYTHSYCNGRKSIDGMPSILSSIPMFVEPFFLSPYSVNNVSGIADCLNDKGYQTAFFHGAKRGSMGFMAFARATKFQQYYGLEDFAADYPIPDDKGFYGLWGVNDEPFMQYFSQKMSDMPQPFMTALFTLSSHHPFLVPEPYQEQFREEHPDMPIYKVIRYTDMALRRFFASASRQKWFANTIFVITSDHTNTAAYPEYKTDLGGFASPIIFYDPSGEMGSGMVDAIAQQTDIMPTILEYLGYDQPYLTFGIDLLNTPKEQTWAVNYLNGIYQYVKYDHVLQFDGEQTRAVYALSDSLMQHDVKGHFAHQSLMERELKAIIQQYLERMTRNELVVKK